MVHTQGRPSGPRWQALVRQVKARREPCCLCGGKIDLSLRYPDPMSHSVQHVIALTVRPDLAWEPSNLRSAHLIHNKRAGTNAQWSLNVGATSEDW